MEQYGQAAVDAVRKLQKKTALTPEDAWDHATNSFSASSGKKSCPRGAFLGLCSGGYIRGVISGNYTRSQKNRRYATKAADMLKANPSLASLGEIALWQKVMRATAEPTDKIHNQQMNVVLALHQHGFIV